MRKALHKLMLQLFFSYRTRAELQERRFDWLLVQLHSCQTWSNLESFKLIKERVLEQDDYKSIRYDYLIQEMELMEAAITHDEIKMQQLRIEYGDLILRRHGII